MSGEIAKREPSSVPSTLTSLFGSETASDLTLNVGGGFPFLSIKGKVWTVVRGKEDRTVITNAEGDVRSSIEVVIIKANPHLSKVFYIKKYVEGSDAKPDCYSNDGVEPAVDSLSPQSPKCSVCPHNQWGSRITEDGKKAKSCADSRRLAVAPLADLKDAMLVRVPAASLQPLKEYGEMFARKGYPYQAAITKMRFDPDSASPKILFEFVDWLNISQAKVVAEMAKSGIVEQILGATAEQAFEVQTEAKLVTSAPPATPIPNTRKAEPQKVKIEDKEVKSEKKPTVVKEASDLASVLDEVLGQTDD